ncbi:putative NAD(P)H-dependent FMN-containing oxidoreductase YwqN [Methanobrevibacter woesei]|uniref:Putative NAD(P)H-dependent FMN-containing oxidoreductase YwqN n=1 Tax=Methanobrevibacter woesei TaxID=190976 RepID=A0A2U1S7U3_9EURY|nr:flavodoxin family protein [Methanobrevibacter woesei]PWB86134.1 putative NAD(P)H-dependent FMN-containing oxidoreductase YwqN [Methanobrevibacter woesei]
MKTVVINGSPRKGGNCETLINELIAEIDGEVSNYFLEESNINFCKACLGCQKGDCVRDDDLNKAMDELQEADLLVFATPIYYGQMTAQAKTFVDRFYQISQNSDKSLEGTKVIVIATQANPTDAFQGYVDGLAGMPFGYMGMEVIGSVVAKGTTGKGDKEDLADAIAEIKKIGENL